MIVVDIRPDLKGLQRAFIALRAKQAPFATALALNRLAKGVVAEEQTLIGQTFDKPTPFTQNAYRIEVATKSKPLAIVAAKDIQAAYLEPYVIGGERYLGSKKAMLAPRQIALNQYGNLPRSKLASLKGKPNVFIGPVKTKSGRVINGVWQRSAPAARRMATRKSNTPRGPLKLLIQFEDTTPAPKHLDFFGRAQRYLKANAAREFTSAMKQALATAR